MAVAGAVLMAATGCTDNGTGAAVDGQRAGAAVTAGTAGMAGTGVPHTSLGAASPRALMRGAADVLTRAGTSRARTRMVTASGGTRVTVDGKGVADYGKRVGKLMVLLPEGASGERPGRRRHVTEIVVPKALYMRNRGAGVPFGKWVRVDTTSIPDGNLLTGGATDPISAAELLRGARQVTYAGTARVGRAPLRHYRGTIDIAAAARDAAPCWHAQLAAAAKGFAERTVPFDAYIDGQGRLRKIRHQFTFATSAQGGSGATEPGGGGAGMAVSSTTWFYGFGAQVSVVLPEAGDIYAGKIAPS